MECITSHFVTLGLKCVEWKRAYLLSKEEKVKTVLDGDEDRPRQVYRLPRTWDHTQWKWRAAKGSVPLSQHSCFTASLRGQVLEEFRKDGHIQNPGNQLLWYGKKSLHHTQSISWSFLSWQPTISAIKPFQVCRIIWRQCGSLECAGWIASSYIRSQDSAARVEIRQDTTESTTTLSLKDVLR